MRIVGNAPAWSRLVTKPLPQAALLIGPDGVGRRTGAISVAEKLSAGHHLVLDSLLAADAAELTRWVERGIGRRVAVVSGAKSSPSGWNRLLKLLESLPELAHVWIVDEGNTPVAIKGRCHHYVFESLTTSQVLTILHRSELVAENMLDILSGEELTSVSQALNLFEANSKASSVVAWLGAVDRGSREDLLAATSGWSEAATKLLRRELEYQYDNETKLGVLLTRARKEPVLRALGILAMEGPPTVSAITAGTYLIDQS